MAQLGVLFLPFSIDLYQSGADMKRSAVSTITWIGVLIAFIAFVNPAFAVVPGTTPGELTVSNSGSARYNIPIDVPPGTAGMQPSLSLNYDSNSGNDLLGVGWGIGGLSTVTRCPQTSFVDGIIGAIRFDTNDRYCLDGQRLIPISGTDGGNGTEYRTELDSNVKVISYTDTAVSNGPAWYKIWTKSGQILEYGNTPDSRIQVIGTTTVRMWAVNKISDRAGNYQTYSYLKDPLTGGYRPDQINYTGNSSKSLVPYNKVVFSYLPGRSDTASLYQAGSPVYVTQLLSAIQTKVGQKLVKSYSLNYETSPSGKSRLTSVTECGSSTGSAADVCLNPTSFAFTDPIAGANLGTNDNPDNTTTGYNSNWKQALIDMNGDGKLDYLRYYMGTSTNTLSQVRVSLNQGDGTFAAYTKWESTTSGYGPGWKRSFVDVNGDGLPDYVRSNGQIRVNLNTGSSFDTSIQSNGYPYQIWHGAGVGALSAGEKQEFIDMTGDGLPDYVLYKVGTSTDSSAYVNVTPNTGTTFYNSKLWEYTSSGYGINWSHSFIDMTGDGLPDLVRYRHTNTGTDVLVYVNTGSVFNKNYQPWDQSAGSYGTGWKQAFIDLNGDKLPDYVRYFMPGNTAGKTKVLVNLNTGTWFDTLTQSWDAAAAATYKTGWLQTFVDMNGDSLPDYVRYWVGNPATAVGGFVVQVAINTGNTFLANEEWYRTSGTYQNGWAADFVDIDGNNLPDFVRYFMSPTGNVGTKLRVNYNVYGSGAPDTITTITDGLKLQTKIEYDPLIVPYGPISNYSNYSKGTGAVYPRRDIKPSFYVVGGIWNLSGTDPITNWPITTRKEAYTYATAREEIGVKGHGFLGFGNIKVHDLVRNITTNKTFRQDFPYIGQVSNTTIKAEDYGYWVLTPPLTISTTDVAFASASPYTGAPKIKQIYPKTTVSKSYEADGSLVRSVTATNDPPDIYGTIKHYVTSVVGGGETYTSTVDDVLYPNDTTKWFLGQIKTRTVTNTHPKPVTPAEASQARTTSYVYDATTGLMTQKIVDPNDMARKVTMVFGHDGFGNVDSVTQSWLDPIGANTITRTTSTPYDAKGQFPLSRTNALSQKESYGFDNRFGTLTSWTDANQLVTSWLYDELGRLRQETRPDTTKTVIKLDFTDTTWTGSAPPPSAGYFVTTTTDSVPTSKIFFDIFRRGYRKEVQGFAAGTSVVVATTYNDRDLVATTSEPGYGSPGPVTSYYYDRFNRPSDVVTPISLSSRASAASYTYSGLTTSVTDAKGRKTQKTVNTRGELIKVVDAANNPPTVYRYNAFGDLRTVQDAAGNITEMRYDKWGHKTYMDDPDTGVHSYIYDPIGQLRKETDAKAQTRVYEYDLLGRLKRRTEPEGVSSWEYDTALHGIGLLAKATGAAGDVRTPGYDAWSRLATNSLTYGGKTVALQYGYDTLGRPYSITYPTGFKAEHRYTATGYLSEVWGSDGRGSTRYWKANSLTADGQLYEATLGNGLSTRTSYDLEGKPTGMLTGTYQNTTLVGSVQNLGFHYDAVGNLDYRYDYRVGLTETFTYDSLNRLDTSLVSGQALKSYDYDALGNLTFKTGVGAYTYSQVNAGPHAVTNTSVGNKVYQYDPNGNLTSGDGRITGYTSYNLPSRIDVGGGQIATTFAYDADRDRVNMTGPEGSRIYMNDGVMRYERVDNSGLTTHTHYLYAMGKLVASYVTDNSGSAETNYMHHDHLGSVDTVTDGTGQVVERLSYDPHGKRRNGSTWADSATAIQPVSGHRGFTEHEHLDYVGLIHMNGRVYDPTLGRFLSADPNVPHPGNPQSFNRYSYVRNSPLSLVDPTGFEDMPTYMLDTVIICGDCDEVNRPVVINLSVSSSIDYSQYVFHPTDTDVEGETCIIVFCWGGESDEEREKREEQQKKQREAAAKALKAAKNAAVRRAAIRGAQARTALTARAGLASPNNPFTPGSYAATSNSFFTGESYSLAANESSFGGTPVPNGQRLINSIDPPIMPLDVLNVTVTAASAFAPAGRLGSVGVAKGANKAPDFIVSPGGTAFPVPKGASGPTPVFNQAGKQTGDAFTGGAGGANGQVTTMRIMDPTPPRGASPGYSNGYIKYENSASPKPQGVDPYTGKTLPNSQSHFPID